MWQEQGSSCAAWIWSPDISKKSTGWCTLASMVDKQVNGTAGTVAGVLGKEWQTHASVAYVLLCGADVCLALGILV